MRTLTILPRVEGERAWSAADRAAGCTHASDYETIRRVRPDTWADIGPEAYWEALECLPPIYVPGGFMVSEPVCDHESAGVVYLCIVGNENSARAAYRTKRQIREAVQ